MACSRLHGIDPIVVVIGQRFLYRLAHRLQARKMDRRRGPAGAQSRRQYGLIADVAEAVKNRDLVTSCPALKSSTMVWDLI